MPATDFRTFGRLSDGLPGTSRRSARRRRRVARRPDVGGPVARRRSRVPRPVVVAVGVVLLALLWVSSVAARQAEPDPDVIATTVPTRPQDDAASRSAPAADQTAAGQAGAGQAGAGQAAAAGQPTPFATVEGLALALPHPQPQAVAFHEANLPAALALEPVGRLEANDNATRFTPPADAEGPGYRVLSSHGRGRPATSGVDVVVPHGAAINAPVAGRVTEVREYALPGGTRDWRIVVESASHPNLSVVLIHLQQPRVAVGDTVEAGVTPLATVRLLPFPSHVDDVTEQRLPHAHLEVKASTDTEPVDPNAPALEAAAEGPLP